MISEPKDPPQGSDDEDFALPAEEQAEREDRDENEANWIQYKQR